MIGVFDTMYLFSSSNGEAFRSPEPEESWTAERGTNCQSSTAKHYAETKKQDEEWMNRFTLEENSHTLSI